MNTRILTTGLTMFLALYLAASAATAADKPNIPIIWGDDVGYWNLSHINHNMMGYQTPNMDRIAKEGIHF